MSEYEVISIIIAAIGLVLTILALSFPVNLIVSGFFLVNTDVH